MENLIKNILKKPPALFIFFYTFILHVILISVIFKPNLAHRLALKLNLTPENEFVVNYITSMNTMHARVDLNTSPNAFIFIGDSLIQGLSVSSIRPISVNFGIGHDTINGVLQRTLNYKSLMSASSVIISVGVNDLRKKTVKDVIIDYKRMLQQLSRIPNIFIHEVLPVDSNLLGIELLKKISLFNEALFKLTKGFDNITLLKSSSNLTDLNGNLKPSLHLGDGLHLNKNGYDIWIQQLKKQLDAK
jgi:lysophospholipase L1-like esterase